MGTVTKAFRQPRALAQVARPFPIMVALAIVVTAAAAGLMFLRATTPWSVLPDNDYWGIIGGLITETGVHFDRAELFQRSNEHIVAVPKLLYAANYAVTSGSNIGLIVYSLLVGAACVGLLLFLAKDLLHDRPWRFAVCAILFPLVMFSPKLVHSYFRAMSGTAWLTADLFVILFAITFGLTVTTGKTTWLLLSLVAALIGVMTFTTGVYAVVILLVYCLANLLVLRLRGVSPCTRFCWSSMKKLSRPNASMY